MASFTFTLVGTSTFQNVVTVPDEAVPRIIDWALNYYPTELDADGNPLDKTPAWAVKRWVEAMVSNSLAKVKAYEITQAIAQVSAPSPIAVTIS